MDCPGDDGEYGVEVADEYVAHTVVSLPALTIGAACTITTTESVAVHPLLSVTVTEYPVVTEGVANGFDTTVEFSDDAGDQEYE